MFLKQTKSNYSNIANYYRLFKEMKHYYIQLIVAILNVVAERFKVK